MGNEEVKFTLESEAVVLYKKLFPEVADDAAIGSVNSMYELIKKGEKPAQGETDISELVSLLKTEADKEISEDSNKEEGGQSEECAGDCGQVSSENSSEEKQEESEEEEA